MENKQKYKWSSDQQAYYGTITDNNSNIKLDDNLLINGTIEDIKGLCKFIDKDRVLGGMWNYLERNIDKEDLYFLLDKFIDVDPRMLNNRTSLLICQNYQAFYILCERGYTIDKKFIDEFIWMLEEICEGETAQDAYKFFMENYGNISLYLSEKGYINYEEFVNKVVYDKYKK